MRNEELMKIVTAMVKLSESYGKHLAWANLVACLGAIGNDTEIRWAVDDLVGGGILEVTPKGLRFALD